MNINRACGLARPGRAPRPARVPAPARRRASEAGPRGLGRVSPSFFVPHPGSPDTFFKSAYLGRPSREIEITDPPLEGAEEIVVGGWWVFFFPLLFFFFSPLSLFPRWPQGKGEIVYRLVVWGAASK